MSLVKSPIVTPEKLAANQANGRESHGPATRSRDLPTCCSGSKRKKHGPGTLKNREMKEGPTMFVITKGRFREPTMLMKIN
jgi:hypothetical protein